MVKNNSKLKKENIERTWHNKLSEWISDQCARIEYFGWRGLKTTNFANKMYALIDLFAAKKCLPFYFKYHCLLTSTQLYLY